MRYGLYFKLFDSRVHMHIYMHIYAYIYIYVRTCACVCVYPSRAHTHLPTRISYKVMFRTGDGRQGMRRERAGEGRRGGWRRGVAWRGNGRVRGAEKPRSRRGSAAKRKKNERRKKEKGRKKGGKEKKSLFLHRGLDGRTKFLAAEKTNHSRIRRVYFVEVYANTPICPSSAYWKRIVEL